MPAADRRFDRGTRRAVRSLRDLGGELRTKRHAVGLSQQAVADAAHIDRARYSRIEAARITSLGILEASRVAAVLGLDLAIRCYPGGDPLRDAAQARLIERISALLAPPLRLRLEVALPGGPDQIELRAWDAVIEGPGGRTRIEVEMRLADAQAQARAISLKQRDDPTGDLLVVVANSRHNRLALDLHPNAFAPLGRLQARAVLAALRRGKHPPTGLVLF